MKVIVKTSLLTALSCLCVFAHAQTQPDLSAGNPTELEQKARKLYERLTGTKVSIDSAEIKSMASHLSKGNLLLAAQVATQDPNFYNITVKLMALPLSTRDETVKTPFNDFAAAVIGVTRDMRDARELLTGNFYYRGSGDNVRSNLVPDILMSNNHYADLETRRIDLRQNLVRVEGQVIATADGIASPNPDPAGVLTLRTFMGEHALMGTNRRLVEYTFREFMCVSLDQWADTQAADSRIGRDIDRFPGGDHMKYLTSCKGCHTVMDGFRGAFAKWEFDGKGIKHSGVNTRGGGDYGIRSDTRGIANKMNKNGDVFPSGFVTVDDSFVNNAVRPNNADLFQWRGPASTGNGVKDFGTVVANSKRFSQCMAKRVYKAVCRKELDENAQKQLLINWGDEFESSGYRLKNLFESIAIKPECLGS